MAGSGTRTITIKFDGSAKGLVAEAVVASRAISGIGSNTSGLKKAEGEFDALGNKIDKTAKSATKSGSLMGGAIALGLSAAAPLIGGALVGGVALGFVGAAALVQKNNADVRASFGDLKSQVVGEMKDASDQVVPYLVKAGNSLQQEFANLGPQLHTAFSFAGPDIKILTTGVNNLANNAMPGFVNAMKNSKPIVQGISNILGDFGAAATTVLNSVSAHSVEFGDDLTQVGTLIKNVGSITAAVLPGLANGFGTTVGTINTLLTALKPIAPAIGQIAGVALPAVGVFKLFSLATAPLENLGTKISNVSGSTVKLGNAVGSLGKSLPLIGAGFALADAGAQKLFGTSDQLANSLLTQTGPALAKTEFQLAKNDATSLGLKKTLGGLGSFLADTFVPTTADTEAGLTDVQKAQIKYNEAVQGFGPKSAQAAQAQQDLARASDADKQSQKNLNQALLNTNEQLFQQEVLLLSTVDANLSMQASVLNVQTAEKTYADAVKSSGKNSLDAKQAFIGLQQAQTGEANAAVASANAANTNASASVQATAESNAFAQSVLGMAAASDGHLTPALQTMVNGLNDAQVSAFTATGKINGTHQAIVDINGKSVTINVDGTGQAVANANAVKSAIDGVQSKTVYLNDYVNVILQGSGAKAAGSQPGLGGLLGLSGKARGGPVMAGVPVIVGDGGGPEIFVPQQSGHIVGTQETADIIGSGGGGGDVYLTGTIVLDLGAGITQRIRVENQRLYRSVKAGAGAR